VKKRAAISRRETYEDFEKSDEIVIPAEEFSQGDADI